MMTTYSHSFVTPKLLQFSEKSQNTSIFRIFWNYSFFCLSIKQWTRPIPHPLTGFNGHTESSQPYPILRLIPDYSHFKSLTAPIIRQILEFSLLSFHSEYFHSQIHRLNPGTPPTQWQVLINTQTTLKLRLIPDYSQAHPPPSGRC